MPSWVILTGPASKRTVPGVHSRFTIAEKQIMINNGFTPRITIENGTLDMTMTLPRKRVATISPKTDLGKNRVITNSRVPASFTRGSSRCRGESSSQ